MSAESVTWLAAWSHWPRLVRLAHSRLGDGAAAEDCASEAVLRVNVRYPVEGDELARLLTTVTLNLCTDRIRRRGEVVRSDTDLESLMPAQPSPEQEVCDDAELRWAIEQLAALPERDLVALRLKAAGARIADIADELGVSESAAEIALRRARRAAATVLTKRVHPTLVSDFATSGVRDVGGHAQPVVASPP